MSISRYKLLNTFTRNHGSIRSLKFYIQVNKFFILQLFSYCCVTFVLSHFPIIKTCLLCVCIMVKLRKIPKPLDVQDQQLGFSKTQLLHEILKPSYFSFVVRVITDFTNALFVKYNCIVAFIP